MSGVNEMRRRRGLKKPGGKMEKETPSQNLIYRGNYSVKAFLTISGLQVLLGLVYFGSVALLMQCPALREYVTPLIKVQHILPNGDSYPGYKDCGIVISSIFLVIAARALIQLVLYALVYKNSTMTPRTKIRFTEQGWCAIYYAFASLYGMYLLRSAPYGWEASTLWQGYPHYFMQPAFKQYYLFILGFWMSQIFIIHIEDRRSDHYQMLLHHFVTCALVWGSYVKCYGRIGHLIMIMMDGVDTFLAMAKCLKYSDAPKLITDGVFMIFLIVWVVCRHIVYMYELLYSQIYATDLIKDNCVYFPGLESMGPVTCFSMVAHRTFFILTMILQAIMLMWLWLIIKVIIKLVRGEDPGDNRSDDEKEDHGDHMDSDADADDDD